MSRRWNELVAALADPVDGVGNLVLLTVLVAALVAALWYLWPIRLNWRWFRRGERGRRWRREGKQRPPAETPVEETGPDEVPDTPAPVLLDLADRLAAEGRFAEAVRERLRAIVRLLIERGVIPATPGLTVTELAAEAVKVRPSLAPPLNQAVDTFSEIWYGQRPAGREDDLALRRGVDAIRAELTRVGAR